MSPETVKAVQEALAPMATKLGEGSEHVYAIYVKQMYAESIMAWAFALLALLGVIASLVVVSRVSRAAKAYVARASKEGYGHTGMDDYPAFIPTMIISSTVLILGAVTLIANVADGVGKSINPEYYAIDRIITQVRGESE